MANDNNDVNGIYIIILRRGNEIGGRGEKQPTGTMVVEARQKLMLRREMGGEEKAEGAGPI